MKVRKGVMCSIDFNYHLEDDPGGSTIYPTLEAAIRNHTPACEYIEVEVKELRVLQKGDN